MKDELVKYLTENRKKLIWVIANICGMSDAEDVFQDAAIKMLGSIENFRGDAKLSTWCHAVCANTAKNFIQNERRDKRDRSLLLDCDISDVTGIEEIFSEEDPLGEVIAAQTAEIVSSIFEKLNQRHQIIFEKAVINEEPYKDIAQQVGIPLGTVKTSVFRSRNIIEGMIA